MVSEMRGMVLLEQTASRAWEGTGSRSCYTVAESEQYGVGVELNHESQNFVRDKFIRHSTLLRISLATTKA